VTARHVEVHLRVEAQVEPRLPADDDDRLLEVLHLPGERAGEDPNLD
jgi:hypothetical protein